MIIPGKRRGESEGYRPVSGFQAAIGKARQTSGEENALDVYHTLNRVSNGDCVVRA
jgi:hypothetical protein